MPFVTLSDHRIEYQDLPATGPGANPLILLHEGLGSIALWRDFPAKLAAATGRRTLVYSRWGYGGSAPLVAPRKLDYMHREALEDLPALRQALGLDDPILVGHSDGASIALIHAGAGKWPVRALILEAPHVFVEDVSIASIRDAKIAYDDGEMKRRLARYHDDVEDTFRGWNDVWLSPEFRGWNIEEYLAGIACPMLAIQGADDEYGTLAQLDAVGSQVKGPFERLVLPNSGHSPHRDQERTVLEAMARFIARV